MVKIGKIVKIDDLRLVWKHEEYDFSKWLAEEENLKQLSDEVGIDIVFTELESNVGAFSVDILASEDGTDRKIIIENQLSDTNHDHLGKIITYAAGKSAEVIIWIVRRARDEHRQAIQWLNQHTDDDVGFFLIEIELWSIDGSLPAPKFNVVERPNEWTKSLKVVEGLSDTKKLQLEFWQAFCEKAYADSSFSKEFGKRKASPKHWYNLSVGNSNYHISLTVNTQKNKIGTGLYIIDNKDIFFAFKEKKDKIEEAIGEELEWIEADKACRILLTTNGNIKNDSSSWEPFFDWFREKAIKFKEVFVKIDNMI